MILLMQVKELSTEELAARNDLVVAFPDRIQAILDDYATPKPSGLGNLGKTCPMT